MMRCYSVYGFQIHSAIPFPLAPASEDSSLPQLTFTLHTGRPVLAEPPRCTLLAERHLSPTYGVELYHGEEGHLLREIAGEDGMADYYLSSDRQRVICYQDPGMPREQIWGFFLAVVMAFLLQQGGRIGLHSSAICYRRGVVAFLAFAGVGKSTMAVEFVKHGHPLMTDDLLPVASQNGSVQAGPGCSLVKMWPETAAQFTQDWMVLPRVAAGTEKRWVCLETAAGVYSSETLPLAAVYLLEPRQANDVSCHQPTIEPLSPMEASIVLGKQTFVGPSMQLDRTAQLRMYSEIASRVPVKRITYAWGFDHLSMARTGIIDDLDRMA